MYIKDLQIILIIIQSKIAHKIKHVSNFMTTKYGIKKMFNSNSKQTLLHPMTIQ